MPEQQPERGYVSTDPNFGAPVEAKGYVSTDPNFGEPVTVRSRTWADRLGLNTPSDSMLGGFVKGAGAGAVDLAQGAVSRVSGAMNAKLDEENTGRREMGVAETATLPRVEQPEGFSGSVGAVLPDVAAMAYPVGGAVKAGVNAIPRTSRAGANFEQVMGAARNIPIETGAVGDAALRVQQLAERGGSMPMAVRKLLLRMTDPNKAAMTYEEARDFASNIGRLSADERKRLTPVVHREVANLAARLNEANAKAAQQAGKGAEYKAAMREYAKAMQLRDALDTVIRRGTQAAIGAAGLGGAAYVFGRD